MSSTNLKICKVLEQPSVLDPNTLYVVLNEDDGEVELSFSDATGDAAYPVVSKMKIDPTLLYMLGAGAGTGSMSATTGEAYAKLSVTEW